MNNINTRQNDGGAVFPTKGTFHGAPYQSDGMSLRDWFAGQALPAIISESMVRLFQQGATSENVATTLADSSYQIADAMLAARNERQEP